MPALPTSAATAATPVSAAPSGWVVPQAAFLACSGFLLVVLPLISDSAAIDVTLVPRLLAILIFLATSLAVFMAVFLGASLAAGGRPAIGRRLDPSVLAAPAVMACGGYAVVTAASLLVAANASAGFTDVFRTLATFLTLCVWCLVLPTVPRWREQLLRVLVVAAVVAVGVGGYEIVTRLGPGLHPRRAMEQITGLMSGVNLYAGILCLLLPWCVCGTILLRGAWRGVAAAAAAGLVAMILVLQSRAAWLALLAAGAATLVPLAIDPARFGLSQRTRRRLATAGLATLVALSAGITAAPADNPFAQRFRSIFFEPGGPGGQPREGGRLMIWGLTARMIADHPLTGVGAGNFTVRLHEYFDDDDLDFSNVHTNWLQPHNDFLWVFAEKGVVGIALFVGCFIAAAAAIRTVLGQASSSTDRWLALAALAGLASYLTLSCFDFPLERINHQVHLALLLAVPTVLAHSMRPADDRPPAVPAGMAGRLAIAASLLVALGLGIAYSLAAIRQEKEVIAARQACRQGRWEEMLAAARRGRTRWKTLDPLASPVAFLEGFALAQLGRVPEAIERLEQARLDNPNRMYVVNNLGILYASTGRFDEAIECFSLTADRYPHRIEPFNNLAICLMETGRPAEAAELLAQIPDELQNDAVRGNLALARSQAADQAAEAAGEAAGDQAADEAGDRAGTSTGTQPSDAAAPVPP